MGKIVTVTVNPAIDKSASVSMIVPEKKLRCSKPLSQAGGGGINISRVIKVLGGESTAVYLKGGSTGDHLQQLLNENDVFSQAISIINPTRENLTILDESTNLQYRFGMPGPYIAEHEWNKCLQVIDGIEDIEFLVASGSLPPGVPVDFYGRVASIARNKKAKMVIDTSGEALKIAVTEGVYLVKPNLAELATLTNKVEILPGEIVETARNLINKYHCEIIVVSMGAGGAFLITATTDCRIAAPIVKKKSTVGAGDSMVAGIIYRLMCNKDIVDAVQFGVACGTAATMNPGTELCKKQDAMDLFSSIRSQWSPLLLRPA